MRGFVFILCTLLSVPCLAQSTTLKDLKSKIAAKAGELSEFRALLTDPDPNNSLAAMQEMLASKDAILIRMAIEVGAYSPDSSVRETALRGYIETGPTLIIRMKFPTLDASSKGTDELNSLLNNMLKASLDPNNEAVASMKVGTMDQELGCFRNAASSNCLLRQSGASISLQFGSDWVTFSLSTDGKYEGAGTLRFNESYPFKAVLAIAE